MKITKQYKGFLGADVVEVDDTYKVIFTKWEFDIHFGSYCYIGYIRNGNSWEKICTYWYSTFYSYPNPLGTFIGQIQYEINKQKCKNQDKRFII